MTISRIFCLSFSWLSVPYWQEPCLPKYIVAFCGFDLSAVAYFSVYWYDLVFLFKIRSWTESASSWSSFIFPHVNFSILLFLDTESVFTVLLWQPGCYEHSCVTPGTSELCFLWGLCLGANWPGPMLFTSTVQHIFFQCWHSLTVDNCST